MFCEFVYVCFHFCYVLGNCECGEVWLIAQQEGESSNALQHGDTGTIVEKASILPTQIEEFVQVQIPAVSIPANENGIPTQKDKSTSPVFPDDFRCPLSLGLMQDPVTVATGQFSAQLTLCFLSVCRALVRISTNKNNFFKMHVQTYDRGSIMRWLNSGHDTCPKT